MKRDAIAFDRRKFLKFGVLAGAGALANSICPGATWSATRERLTILSSVALDNLHPYAYSSGPQYGIWYNMIEPLVDVDEGRANPRVVVDAMAGAQLLRRGTTRLELQAGLLNAFDTTYLLNFLSIFNGTHYGAPRSWMARMKVSF